MPETGHKFLIRHKDSIGKLGEIPSSAEIIKQGSAGPPGFVDEAAALAKHCDHISAK